MNTLPIYIVVTAATDEKWIEALIGIVEQTAMPSFLQKSAWRFAIKSDEELRRAAEQLRRGEARLREAAEKLARSAAGIEEALIQNSAAL